MIPAVVIPIMYSLAGHGLSEHAGERTWTRAATRRLRRRTLHAGALERRNPLPVGRYWIDIFDDGKSAWDAWLATANIATDPTTYSGPSDRVQVIKEEYYPPFVGSDENEYPGRYWMLFKVVQPTPWTIANKVGWPNTAPTNINTSDDTVQKPDPNDARTDWLPDVSPLGKIAIAGGGILVVAVLAGYAVRSFR